MLRSIWQILSCVYSRGRTGIDKGNIEHLRADLRFRLAMLEYAYYGKSGRRVTKCLAELKSVLGEKGAHRYLRTLDPDLRAQFVERFQGVRREARSEGDRPPKHAGGGESLAALAALKRSGQGSPLSSNVVPIDYASRRVKAAGGAPSPGDGAPANPGDRSVDSGD